METFIERTNKGFARRLLLLTGALIAGASQATPALAGYDDTGREAMETRDVNIGGQMRSMMTVTGVLVRDADDKNFQLRDTRGRVMRVETSRTSMAEASNKLVAGDSVRVYGEWRDNMLYATNLRFLGRNRVTTGTRVFYDRYYYVVGSRNTLTGTLVTDADDDEFEMRAADGRVYMIRTRLIPDSFGANKLQEGDRVRVHGSWFVADERPQLEASNLVVLSRR